MADFRIGVVQENAIRAIDFKFRNQSIGSFKLKASNPFHNSYGGKADYWVKVKWKKAVKREQAKWSRNDGLYTTRLVKASLKGQPQTLQYLERAFGLKFSNFLKA